MTLDKNKLLLEKYQIFSECYKMVQIIFMSKEPCGWLAIIDALFVLMYTHHDYYQYVLIHWHSKCNYLIIHVYKTY